jgi:diacylglycerol kinase family enzyme
MSTLPAPVVSPAFQWGRRWHAGGRHVVLVANGSASGLGRKREALERARGALGLWGSRVETHVTTNVDELTELWPSFQERRVVLLGGDGSLHAAANLPFGPPELAILPAGRANNIARALGIPLELRKAAELATNGRPRQLDLIAATAGPRTYLAVEGVSVGLHAVARASYQAPNSADVAAAVRSGLRAARRFAGVTVCVSTDGVPELLTVGQLFVANLSLFAFGLKVAPGARPDDGLLDLVALPWEGRAHIVPTIARLRRGTHLVRPGARAWTAERVRVSTRGRSPVIADTTNLGTGPVTLEVVPSALAVVAP